MLNYLKNDVILGKGYPYELMFLHSVYAITSWRTFDEMNPIGSPNAWTYNLICSFFCHGFGGTHFRDWSMGQTPSSYKNPDLHMAWVMAYLMVYHSPNDLVYSLVSTPHTISRYGLCLFEAIDSATTICGSIDKAQGLFPGVLGAQMVAAVTAGIGGSYFRYLERKFGRGMMTVETELFAPTTTLRRTLLYAVVYIVVAQRFGSRNARFWITLFHIAWSLASESTGQSLDFTAGFGI